MAVYTDGELRWTVFVLSDLVDKHIWNAFFSQCYLLGIITLEWKKIDNFIDTTFLFISSWFTVQGLGLEVESVGRTGALVQTRLGLPAQSFVQSNKKKLGIKYYDDRLNASV